MKRTRGQERCRKLIQSESKNNGGGDKTKKGMRRRGKKEREGEGTISGGTQRDDLALNHRRS